MEKQRQVSCADNEELAAFMWNKRKEMAEGPKGLSDNVDLTLSKAYFNVCNSKNPIKTLKDFSQIKGVGKWILKLMQDFFDRDSGTSENEELIGKGQLQWEELSKGTKYSSPMEGVCEGKRNKGTRRYVPQKNSVAYALLITLYRGTANEINFMRKQELIDAAEASGLSRVPIMPEKGKGKPGQFGSSPRDWYNGWNCMKTLITKGMVVKSSCPAKYMLTEEGKVVARECLSRSGFVDSIESTSTAQMFPNVDQSKMSDLECSRIDLVEEVSLQYVGSSKQKKPGDIPPEFLDRFLPMGYSKEQILHAFSEVSESFPNKEISSLWPSVLCRLREDEVYGLPMKSQKSQREKPVAPISCKPRDGQDDICIIEDRSMTLIGAGTSDALKTSLSMDSGISSSGLRACSSNDNDVLRQGREGAKSNRLAMPPLSFGEKFEDIYEVVLILDDREKFAGQGSKGRKIIEHIHTQFKIPIEVRRLPVGDGIWIARHKHLATEYVLDFIVERKNVDDLRSSIRDNRYKDQKVRLLRCGLKKMIYLVEGDPNASQAAESIKTACFTTEILEGFDVQRTSGLADTLKKYGYLTRAISQHYRSVDPEEEKHKSIGVCPPFNEFMRRCQDLDKVTVSDVFAIQLIQVPQVTEDVAISVLDMYPTVLSLARAYALLEGDTSAQEEMLRKQSNNLINGVASRNIFQLIWGN